MVEAPARGQYCASSGFLDRKGACRKPDGCSCDRIEALERRLAEARAEIDVQRTSKEYAQRCCEAAEAERDRLAADNARLREALERLLNPAPGVKKLPPWVYGIAKPTLAGKE